MTKGFSGRCLCGKVSYQCDAEPVMAGHCHCVDCRKSSGTGHCTHVLVPVGAFHLEGEVRYYDHPADSGHVISRGFCPSCGCAIHSKNSAQPDMAFIRASSLDDPDIVTPQMVVYASRAPSWDHVDPSLPSFAEMPGQG